MEGLGIVCLSGVKPKIVVDLQIVSRRCGRKGGGVTSLSHMQSRFAGASDDDEQEGTVEELRALPVEDLHAAPHGLQLPIHKPFTWYALVQPVRASDAGAYDKSLLTLGTCHDFTEFARFFNHVPMPGTQILNGTSQWKIARRYWGHGLCFFEKETSPEWEHPNNERGVDLVVRQCFAPEALREAWIALLLLFINGEAADATGARIVFRQDRRTGNHTHKLEVWCRDIETAMTTSHLLKRRTGHAFTVTRRKVGR